MKKFLLSLIMMAFAGYVSAQSFTFEHNGETIEPGYYEVVGDIDYNTWDMQFIVDITNNSGAPINVTCVRTITEQSEGTSFTMCFGELCGGPYTERLDADIASGASEEFSAHFVPLFNDDFTKPIYLFSQTTKNKEEFEELVSIIGEKMKECGNKQFYPTNSICKRMASRTKTLRDFADSVDALLFVSGRHSSNGNYLFDFCKQHKKETYFISEKEDIDIEELKKYNKIGISGATSTPMWLMEEIRDYVLEKIKNN